MAARRFTPHPLHVLPELLGAELPSPLRRALALALDIFLLLPLTITGAMLATGMFLRLDDPKGYEAVRTLAFSGADSTVRIAALRDAMPLLVRHECRGLPAAAIVAVEEHDLDRAVETMRGYDLFFALNLMPEGPEQKVPPHTVRVQLDEMIPFAARALALLFVPGLYFTILTRRGATAGKWLLGLRVRQLGGERLSWRESFERFGGYIHAVSSLGLGLLDLWTDPNRRMAHDRAAHTVVVRVRRAPKAKPPARRPTSRA